MRRWVAAAAVVVILVVTGAFFHNAVAKASLGIAALATGYSISADDVRFGTRHGALIGVRITRGPDPVLEAARIDVDYNPRDLLPGSRHRFGISAIAIDAPHVTLVHHQDGTYNVSFPKPGPPGPPGPANPVPLDLTIRVRNATASLIDEYRYYKASRRQRVDRIDADVQINSAARTWYRVTGFLEDTGSQHFRMAGSMDARTGFSLHHLNAKAIPIATVSNYFINSNAAQVLGGTVRDMDMRMWSFAEPAMHMSGEGELAGGTIIVRGMDSPIRALTGRITLFDSGFASKRLTAVVGHLPIVCSGGIFDFAQPQFRLGFSGTSDLRYLHEIMRIANNLPIYGGVTIHALVEGDIANPVLMVGFTGKHWNYGAVPLDDPHGTVALLKDHLIVLPFHTTYASMKMHVQGDLQLQKVTHSILAVHAVGPSRGIPYLGALVPDQPVVMETLMKGDDLKVDAQGYIVSLQDPSNVNGFFTLDRYGEGVFGPMMVREPSGGTLVAGFSLDRKNGNSTFWASAHDMQLRQPQPVNLPGVAIPEMPPMDAHINDAEIAGSGSASNVVIGGTVGMSPAVIAGVGFDSINATFAGPFAASNLSNVTASGPWGTFKGSGTFGTGAIVASGDYRGTLDGLHQFISLPAHGAVNGRMAIAIAQGKIFVQARDARLADATIQSIPISSMSGTMSFYDNVLRIYSASAHAAGGTVDVAGTFATGPSAQRTQLALVTTPLQASALHGLGVPLTAGTLRAAGTISPAGNVPDMNAGVVVDRASLLGYAPFATSAEIAISGGSLQLNEGVASLASTVARVRGTIGGIASSVPTYDVNADVPAGSIQAMTALAKFPAYNTTGSFDGSVRITGSGLQPRVLGSVNVPEGSINGLGFREASAYIDASAKNISVQNARVTFGSTTAQFSANVRPNALAFSLNAPHATLSDFNDYFNTGDTLAGHGAVDISFAHFNNLTFTSGDINVLDLRYRALPIGDTIARWNGVRNIVQGGISVGGEHGRLNAQGTIAFAQSTSVAQIISGSRYNIGASLQNFDLTTWLPALGYPQLPITGRVDGSARVNGAYPHLQLAMNASVRDGTLGPLTIDTATLVAKSAPGDRISITSMAFALPALQANGSGSFGLSATAPMNVQLHATSTDVGRLIAETTKRHIDVSGRFESTVQIGGTIRAPTFSAGVEGTNVDAFGIRIPSFFGQVLLHRRDLALRNARFTFEHGSATLAGSLPLELNPLAFGSPSSPISMDVSAQDVDLSQFADFLGNDTRLAGTLSGHVGISGTVGNPEIFGDLALANASYVSSLETTPITNTVARLSFGGTHASLDQLHARLGSGTMDASGTLSFGGGLNGGPLGYSIAAVTRGAQLSSPTFGSGTFDSSISFARDPGKLGVAKGKVAMRDTIIPLGAFLQLGGPPGAAGAPPAPPLNLGFNLSITAGKNVRVRGGGAGLFGLDIAATGAVHLTGTLQKPTLAGTFDSAGGSLTYIDHAFRIQKGTVTFNPANGVLPDLYAVATTRVLNPDPNTARNPTGYADITAQVSGTVPDVKVSFTSNPPGYTDQQIIALLLPLGGLVGPIQFTDTGVILPAGQLAGAPMPISAGALPDIFERRQNGTVTIGQEAFSILNTQFASGILAPLETALGSTFGLSDLNLTVDYGGNVGVEARRLLGNNVYALYGTTFTVPLRQTFGLAYQPNAFTSAQFTMFVQQGSTPLFYAPNQTLSSNPRVSAGQAELGQNGFTFLFQRLF